MGDAGHGLRTLTQRKPAQAHHAVFGGHILHHGARGRNGAAARDKRNNVGFQAAVLFGVYAVQADKALAAFAAVCALQKVQLAANARKLACAGALGIFLAHQVQLNTAVDADEIADAAHALGGMDVIQITGVENIRFGIQPVIQGLAAHGKVPRTAPGIDLFAGIGEFTGLVQL